MGALGLNLYGAHKHRPQNAFLTPCHSRFKYPTCIHTCHLRAGPSATRGAIERGTRAKDKVTTRIRRINRFRKKFDMVDQGTVCPRDTALHQCRPDCGRNPDKLRTILYLQIVGMLSNQKKPITTPRDIANKMAISRHIDGNGITITVARDVLHRDTAVGMQLCLNNTHGGFDRMLARRDTPKVS